MCGYALNVEDIIQAAERKDPSKVSPDIDDPQPRGIEPAATARNLDKEAEDASVDKSDVREINRKCLRSHVGL